MPTFKQFLSTIWFGRYAEAVPGVVSTSGWEHTTVGERNSDNSRAGFHSWIYLYNEEEDGDCDYLGYIDSLKTGTTTILSMPVILYGSNKASTAFHIGASPELEIAMGTLCHIARPNAPCYVQGSDETKYTMDSHSVIYNGVEYLEGAHPML